MGESGLFQREREEEVREREQRVWERELLDELAEEERLYESGGFEMMREKRLKGAAEAAAREGNVEVLLEEENRLRRIRDFLDARGERELMGVITKKSVEEHLNQFVDGKRKYREFLGALGKERSIPYRREENKVILENPQFYERLQNRWRILNTVKEEYSKAA